MEQGFATARSFVYSGDNTVELLFGTLVGVMFVVCFVITIVILRMRHRQPLKKKSPKLIILGVIGNFLCLANLAVVAVFFQMVMLNQAECYYKRDHYGEDHALGDACMAEWFARAPVQAMRLAETINRTMFFSVSTQLATWPYLLRSWRIKKMHELRDRYCCEERLPRRRIQLWSENYVMIGLLLAIAIKAGIDAAYMFSLDTTYNFLFSVSDIIDSRGQMLGEE